jgi:hypothetical protein
MFEPGDILRYNYSGLASLMPAKSLAVGATGLSCCEDPTNPANLFLFPFTSQQPAQDRFALALRAIRRA